MNRNKLILHPGDPEQIPPPVAQISALLREIGFIGDASGPTEEANFLPGDRFLELITFLGCSPVVSIFTSSAGGENADRFCKIHLRGTGQTLEFLAGANVATPRCPRCRLREERWAGLIALWQEDPFGYRWTCTGCGQQALLHQLDWRQTAGFGRLFIEIWGIHAAEAVPTDPLLEALSRSGGGPWKYFFLAVLPSQGHGPT
jgi:hypothetical protein